MHAVKSETVGMKRKQQTKPIQYTLRGIPEAADKLLREKAATYGLSLNETALKVLQTGLGQANQPLHHDFDAYAGTWVQDDAFDEAIQEMDRIDEEMWS